MEGRGPAWWGWRGVAAGGRRRRGAGRAATAGRHGSLTHFQLAIILIQFSLHNLRYSPCERRKRGGRGEFLQKAVGWVVVGGWVPARARTCARREGSWWGACVLRRRSERSGCEGGQPRWGRGRAGNVRGAGSRGQVGFLPSAKMSGPLRHFVIETESNCPRFWTN